MNRPRQAPQPPGRAPGRRAPAEAVTWLLDGNVLVALCMPDHVHHAPARAWFAAEQVPFATTPITQGTLIRLLMMLAGQSFAAALSALTQVVALPRHRFWPDAIGYHDVRTAGVLGHRQVTDAYLAQLARHHAGRLATFDAGLAAIHADVATLLPVTAPVSAPRA